MPGNVTLHINSKWRKWNIFSLAEKPKLRKTKGLPKVHSLVGEGVWHRLAHPGLFASGPPVTCSFMSPSCQVTCQEYSELETGTDVKRKWMSEEAWWVSNDSLNEAAHPWPPLLRAVATDSWALGARMQSTNHPSLLVLGTGRKWFLNEPLSSDDEDLYFLACAIHPKTLPLLSISLLISVSTPSIAHFCIGVHTHLQRTYTSHTGHTCQSHLLLHGTTVTQRRKPSLCLWLCTRRPLQSCHGKDDLADNIIYVSLNTSRLPWCYSRQPNTFIVYLANVPASFWYHFLWSSEPPFVFPPPSLQTLTFPSPSSHQKTCPAAHGSFSHDHLFWHLLLDLWKQQNMILSSL